MVDQRADPDPHQAHDRVAHGLAHAPDLAVATLVDRQLDQRAAADRARLPRHLHELRPRTGGSGAPAAPGTALEARNLGGGNQ